MTKKSCALNAPRMAEACALTVRHHSVVVLGASIGFITDAANHAQKTANNHQSRCPLKRLHISLGDVEELCPTNLFYINNRISIRFTQGKTVAWPSFAPLRIFEPAPTRTAPTNGRGRGRARYCNRR